jgi:hypothetical protein
MKLYVNFPIPSTVREFLLTFLVRWKSGYVCYANATYFDKECKLIHCDPNKYRGFDDILNVVQTYFPEIDEKQLMHHLVMLELDDKYYGHFGVCKDVGILRYILYTEVDYIDIFNNYTPEKSRYNWRDLFLLLDIHNTEEIKNYILIHKKQYST